MKITRTYRGVADKVFVDLSLFKDTQAGEYYYLELEKLYMKAEYDAIMRQIEGRYWHYLKDDIANFKKSYAPTGESTLGGNLYNNLWFRYIEVRFDDGWKAILERKWDLADEILRDLSGFRSTKVGKFNYDILNELYMYAKFDEIKSGINEKAFFFVYNKYMTPFYNNYVDGKKGAGRGLYQELGFLLAQQHILQDEDYKATRILDTWDLTKQGNPFEHVLQQARRSAERSDDTSSHQDQDKPIDQAAKGGIDFTSSNLDMQIKRDGTGMILPVSQQNLDGIIIDGLVPVILDIKPAVR